MPTEAELKKLDELIAGNDTSGATFGTTPDEQKSQITDIFRNVYGQDPGESEFASLLPLATGKQADFARKLPELESQFGSLAFQAQPKAPEPGVNRAIDVEQKALAERQGLPTVGTGQPSYQFFDSQHGVEVYAPQGSHFELFPGGGVKVVPGLIARTDRTQPLAGAPASSLFTQPTNAQGAVSGFKQEQLAYQPIEGKEIKRTGQTVKNPTTGVDEHAGPGEVLIEYTDGTVERRPIGGGPGTATPLGSFGRTAEELGITRSTEIKGGAGGEITRAPMSAAQALAAAKTPEEADAIITGEGGISTKDLQHVGDTYRGQTAKEGNTFYVDPKTKQILERPKSVQSLAQPLTVAGVAGTKIDVVDKFRAVFGRDPNADELKYWLGRTDKVGVELVSIMQQAKQQGQPAGTAAKAAIADPVEALKSEANTQQAKYAQVYNEEGITTSSSDLKRIRADIEATKVPTGQSQLEFTREQMATSQMQESTNALNKAKDSLRKLDADYLSNIEKSERTPGLSMGAIRRNQGELDIAYNRTRRDLVAEVEAKAEVVSSQTAIMGLMIDAFQSDRASAQVEYTNRLNKATSLYNMLSQEQQFEHSVQQDYINSQRANLSVMTGLISEGRLNYDNLSKEDKSRISSMEQAVGLSGITSAIAKTPLPPVVSIGSPITDASGTNHIPIYSQNPSTGEVSISYYDTPFKERVPGGGGGSSDILSGLLSGVLGQGTSDWVVEPSGTSAVNNLEPPAMSGIPGTTLEYPAGSGYIWTADKSGNWT